MARPRKGDLGRPGVGVNAPGLQVSRADATLSSGAAGISLMVMGLLVLLITLFGWGTTLDFYLACSAAFALIAYAEEGNA